MRQAVLNVTKDTPPSFLAVADDDRRCAEVCVAFYQALKKAGVSGELHIYASGGHGFGMTRAAHADHDLDGQAARLDGRSRVISRKADKPAVAAGRRHERGPHPRPRRHRPPESRPPRDFRST